MSEQTAQGLLILAEISGICFVFFVAVMAICGAGIWIDHKVHGGPPPNGY